MAKFKGDVVDQLGALEKEMMNIEEKAAKAKASCLHRNKKGKLKLDTFNKKKKGGRGSNSVMICPYCKEVMNIGMISEEELEAAIETIHNALQQVRCMVDPENEADVTLAKIYGTLDYNLKGLQKAYLKANKQHGGKDHKHKKDKSNIGYYGTDAKLL